MSNTITELPVERDQYGYWTHPEYNKFCDGREHISTDEFNAWMSANGLEWKVFYRDKDEIDPQVDGYDISSCQPENPEGEGWFIGSIHDSEDGAVCIWLRNLPMKARRGEHALCLKCNEGARGGCSACAYNER